MKDDYLWDGSGDPDPEIQKLEAALGHFRHQGTAPEFPVFVEVPAPTPLAWLLRPGSALAIGSALAVFLIIGAVWYALRTPKPPSPTAVGWDVANLAGAPRVGTKTIGKVSETGTLGVGQTLVTDSQSRASITVDEIGEIDVDSDTRLRLLQTGSNQKRLALDRGTIHAAIWAPPGEFVVDTPSAMAVDMGCAYTLTVDASGAGLLRTTLGWVGFKQAGHESFIPAGAVCATRPGIGPGTPYFEDATPSFCAALTKFDFETRTAAERDLELDLLVKEARKRDALTLWHLLSRVSLPERALVYDRLAALVPPPQLVTREGVLSLNQTMLDLWWNKLDLGDVTLWRTWERSWSGRKNNGG